MFVPPCLTISHNLSHCITFELITLDRGRLICIVVGRFSSSFKDHELNLPMMIQKALLSAVPSSVYNFNKYLFSDVNRITFQNHLEGQIMPLGLTLPAPALDLGENLMQLWTRITLVRLQKLIKTTSQRMCVVIKAKGYILQHVGCFSWLGRRFTLLVSLKVIWIKNILPNFG